MTCSGCINNIINYNINNEKLLNSNNNRSKNKAPLGYRRFQIGCVFTEYDLLNTMNLIQNLIYNFIIGIILTQFYINISRQEHQIDVLYVSFNA